MMHDARSGGVRNTVEGTAGALNIFRHQTSLMLNVIFELRTEVLEETHDRECGSITQCTNRPTADIAADGEAQIQIFHLALTVLDTVNDLVKPVGAFTARRTLTT